MSDSRGNLTNVSVEEDDTDFGKIADELRHASDEARREAARDPDNRDELRRKARALESAAERIEREAEKRQHFVAFNDERY
jgi:hypothetical protein